MSFIGQTCFWYLSRGLPSSVAQNIIKNYFGNNIHIYSYHLWLWTFSLPPNCFIYTVHVIVTQCISLTCSLSPLWPNASYSHLLHFVFWWNFSVWTILCCKVLHSCSHVLQSKEFSCITNFLNLCPLDSCFVLRFSSFFFLFILTASYSCLLRGFLHTLITF